jgi:hypothetical protein
MVEVFRAGLPNSLAMAGLFEEPAIVIKIFIVFFFVVSDAPFGERVELGAEEAGFLDPAHEDIRVFFQVMVKGRRAAPARADDQEIRQPYRPAFFHEWATFFKLKNR